MKKFILALLLGGFILAGTFAKTAVVYFSATGTTERMAKNALLLQALRNILKVC